MRHRGDAIGKESVNQSGHERRTPIAGHAILADDGTLHLRGLILKPDGSQAIATERRGAASDAEAMGRDAGHELKRRGGPGFLST